MEKLPDLSDISAFLEINQLDLDTEIATCAAYYYRIGCLASEAKDMYENAVITLETYETQLASNILKGNKVDKITQTEIKRSFKEDTKWQRLKTEELKLQHNHAVLEKATRAIEMKGHMLTSLNQRQIAKAKLGIGILNNEQNGGNHD
jgi:hypothetical protein